MAAIIVFAASAGSEPESTDDQATPPAVWASFTLSAGIAGNSGAFTQAEMEKMANSPAAKKHKTTPADVAGRAMVDAFESSPFHGFAGSDGKLMYRLSRLVPERAAKLIQKQMAALLG